MTNTVEAAAIAVLKKAAPYIHYNHFSKKDLSIENAAITVRAGSLSRDAQREIYSAMKALASQDLGVAWDKKNGEIKVTSREASPDSTYPALLSFKDSLIEREVNIPGSNLTATVGLVRN